MSEKETTITDKIGSHEKPNPFADLKIADVFGPLITISVLILLVVFVYFPIGMEIPELLAQNEDLVLKHEKRQKKVNSLNSMDASVIGDVEEALDSAIPDRFDVSVLANAVDQLARKNNLRPSELTLSDEPALGFQQQIEQEGEVKGLKSITGVFSFKGELEDINSFVRSLVTSSRLIVVEEFSLKRVAIIDKDGIYQGDEWSIDVTLTAYSYTMFGETRYDEPLLAVPDIKQVEDLIVSPVEEEG